MPIFKLLCRIGAEPKGPAGFARLIRCLLSTNLQVHFHVASICDWHSVERCRLEFAIQHYFEGEKIDLVRESLLENNIARKAV